MFLTRAVNQEYLNQHAHAFQGHLGSRIDAVFQVTVYCLGSGILINLYNSGPCRFLNYCPFLTRAVNWEYLDHSVLQNPTKSGTHPRSFSYDIGILISLCNSGLCRFLNWCPFLKWAANWEYLNHIGFHNNSVEPKAILTSQTPTAAVAPSQETMVSSTCLVIEPTCEFCTVGSYASLSVCALLAPYIILSCARGAGSPVNRQSSKPRRDTVR